MILVEFDSLRLILKLITLPEELAKSRYAGNYDLELFRRLLRSSLVFSFILLGFALFSVIVIFKLFSPVSNNYSLLANLWTNFISTDAVIALSLFFIGFYALLSLNYLWFIMPSYLKLISLKYLKCNPEIRWKGWDFQDLIFSDPVKLNPKKLVSFLVDSSCDYVFYLLIQRADGSLYWCAVTNNEDIKKCAKEWAKNHSSALPEYFVPIKAESAIALKHSDIMRKCKAKGGAIVALRIRSDIFGNEVVIRNLQLDAISSK